MKDRNIRDLLKKTELQSYIADYPHSKIIEEMKLPVAKARIDIAVVNGHLHGYEIKSASDTLQRLPSQVTAYSKIFDYLTVVTEFKYHHKLNDILPEWVGIAVCSDKVTEEEYEIIRPPIRNEEKDNFYIAKLLWVSELYELLKEQNITFKKSERSWALYQKLAANLETDHLSDLVREKLKFRKKIEIKEGYVIKQYGGSGLFEPML